MGTAALACKQGHLTTTDELVFPQSAVTALEEQIVRTTCALCPCGCGLEVRVVDGKAVKIEGNPLHPLNQGVCCLAGQAAWKYSTALSVCHPAPARAASSARNSGDWEEIPWDEALAIVAGKLGDLRRRRQAHTVALLHGETRGQMRGLVERFMQAYGSPNVISQDSLGEGAARLACCFRRGSTGCRCTI